MKINDFGVKIGGAKKDKWKERNFCIEDLDTLSDGEAFKYCTKDQIWKKPDYKELCKYKSKLLVFCIKKIRDSLPAKVRPTSNEAKNKDNRKLFIEFISLVRDVVMNLKSEGELRDLFNRIFVDNGYYNNGWTQKAYYYFGTSIKNKFVRNVQIIPRRLKYLESEMNEIGFPDSLVRKKILVVRELEPGKFFICENNKYYYSRICQTPFKSIDEAEKYMESMPKKKSTALRLEKPELKNIKRKGPYKRDFEVSTVSITKTFKFRGGEFGNYASDSERQLHIDYCFDALMDLAYVLNVSPDFISLKRKDGSSLGIAFGARGSGKALAHYESYRNVINLTKVRGAGCLAHEWCHSLDAFLGYICEDTNSFPYASFHMTKSKNLPQNLLKAFKELVHSLKYVKMSENEIKDSINRKIKLEKESITYWLDSILKSFSCEQHRYNRGKNDIIRSAINEEIEKFNSLVSDLLKDGTSAKEIYLLYKKVKGRLPDKFYRDTINNDLYRLTDLREKLLAANKLKMENYSDFFMEAKRLDGKRKKAYFSSIIEMLARAFEAYVEDSLTKSNFISQYLVHSTSNSVYLLNYKPYPEGAERKIIDKKFDQFFIVLKEFLNTKDFKINSISAKKSSKSKIKKENKNYVLSKENNLFQTNLIGEQLSLF